jgi:hypothetical protein
MPKKENITVRPNKDRLINILDDINKGRIKIPLFQREFVWKDKQMIELFDSMQKGYPIGSLLFWKPQEEYKYYENFGPYKIDEKSNDVKYVLDGFQRLSTLFGALTNPNRLPQYKKETPSKGYAIFYDLIEEEFTYSRKRTPDINLIPLYVLIDTFDFLSFISDMQKLVASEDMYNKLVTKAKQLAKTFVDYEIPYIDITGGDISSSVDIFSRINSTGTRISTDWMVSALSYNPNEGFLFSEKIEEFILKLEKYNFENLSRETILHCIESATGKSYFDVKAESLARDYNFPIIVLSTLKHIERAINFLVAELNVIEYRLLPYNTQLIFLTEFFRLNPNPLKYQEEKLKNWFWITSYSNYFTITSISKQRRALLEFRQFAEGLNENPVFYPEPNQTFNTSSTPDKIDFGSVRSKTLMLFMLNRFYENEIKFDDYPTLELRYLTSGKKTTGNLVPMRSNDINIPNSFMDKKNDASFLLKEPGNQYRYFLNPDIFNLFHTLNFELMISNRLDLIRKLEADFVSSLGLQYSYDDIPF